jgi:hypothetical protein
VHSRNAYLYRQKTPNVTLLAVVQSQEPREYKHKEHEVSDGNEEYVVFGFGDIRNRTKPRAFCRASADDDHTLNLVKELFSQERQEIKHTMNASSKVDEPRNGGNADNNLVSLPGLNPKNVAIKQKSRRKKKSPPTRAEQLEMTQIRTRQTRRTAWPQKSGRH